MPGRLAGASAAAEPLIVTLGNPLAAGHGCQQILAAHSAAAMMTSQIGSLIST
jgi:hypothetical protein